MGVVKDHPLEYKVWENIKTRVRRSPWYKNTELGFTSFKEFLMDVGPRPSIKHSIDRIDNARGYVPGNLRWALQKEQLRNYSRNRRVIVDGRSMVLIDAARKLNINYTSLIYRMNKGVSFEEAVKGLGPFVDHWNGRG